MRSGIARWTGFLALPLLGAVTPLVAYPAITSSYGSQGFVAIALGQSIGAGGSVLVELGWTLSGPQLVAGLDADAARRQYVLATRTKLIALAVILPLSITLTAILAGEHLLAAMGACAATVMSGATGAWFFTGLGRPGLIVLSEALPRFIATVAGAVLLTQTPMSLAGFTALILLASIVAPLITWHIVMSNHSGRAPWSWRELATVFRNQMAAVSGRSVSAAYVALPTAFVQVVSPGSLALFAATERLVRMGLLIMQSVPNALQRWIGQADSTNHRQRVARLLVSQFGLGVFAAVTCVVALPRAADIIFTGTVTLTADIAALGGLIALFTCTSRGTGLALVSFRAVHRILQSALAGAMIGLPMLLFGAAWEGAIGAMGALALAEGIVLAIQAVCLWRLLRG